VKTLVVSLLRMGDFFQQIQLLRQLSETTQVHVLLNESLREAAAIFPEFEYRFFPRQQLQDLLTSSQANTLAAFETLQNFCSGLNQEGYSEIQNWTHNFLSARLIDLLEVPKKTGCRFEQGQAVKMRCAEVYLNEVWGPSRRPSFHWMDAVQMSLGVSRAALMKADQHRHGPTYLQIFTSDEKKNWPQVQWLEVAARIRDLGEDVRILCAPFELEKLKTEFYAYRIEVLGLADLRDTLTKAKLVISGDTAIIHLAALTRTPVLGLYLGSADPFKTGPQQHLARVLWPEVDCSPCRHAKACDQRSHLCAESLKPEDVLSEVESMMGHGVKSNRASNLRAFGVLPGPTGRTLLSEMGQGQDQAWAQLVWEFYLNRDHEQNVAPYGSAARLMSQQIICRKSGRSWIEILKVKVQKTEVILEDLSFLIWKDLKSLNAGQRQDSSDAQMRLLTESLRVLWPRADFFNRLVESMHVGDENPFLKLKTRKEALHEAAELTFIQKNLVRKLEQELTEKEDTDGARA
jgi:ADP-heptose:LPS heptosyltransferase